MLKICRDKENIILKMSYYPKSESYVKNKIKDELSLSNHAARSEVKMQKVLIHQNLLKNFI